jgi:N-formylglutamate amidohydrolase
MRIVDAYGDVPPFEVLAADGEAPFVFNAPHSGTHYPRDLVRRSRLDRSALRRSEDTFVDELFLGVTRFGAPLMRANFPRVYVDLNREATEIDTAMFDGAVGVPVAADSARVAGGLGVIARIVGERQEIYAGPLPAAEAQQRLERFYHPYHRRLAALVEEKVQAFGTCVLVDCHSMPSGAVRAADDGAGGRPDIIIGDRFGTSCSPALADELSRLLKRQGFAVGRNRPYAGGHITERYGAPPRVHAVQLEINRGLYMDESTYRMTPAFGALRDDLLCVAAQLIEWFTALHCSSRWPLAAE